MLSCIVGDQCYGDLVANANLGTLAQEVTLLGGVRRSEIVDLAGNTGRGSDNAQLYNGVFGFVGNEWVYQFTILEERGVMLFPDSVTGSLYALLLDSPVTETAVVQGPNGTVERHQNAPNLVRFEQFDQNSQQPAMWDGLAPGTYYLSIEPNGAAPVNFEFRLGVGEPPQGLSPDNPIPLGVLGDNTTTLAFDTFGSATADTEIGVYSVTPGTIGDQISILELPPFPGSTHPIVLNDDFTPNNYHSAVLFSPQDGKYLVAVGVYDTSYFQDGRWNEGPGNLGLSGAFLTLNYGELVEEGGTPRFSPVFDGAIEPIDSVTQQTDEEGLVWFSFEIKTIDVSLLNVEVEDGSATIRWQSETRASYQVQRSTDLKTWRNATELLPGTGRAMSYSRPVLSERISYLVSDEVDPRSVQSADLDGDGDLDFAVLDSSSRVKWVRNDGNEGWTVLPVAGGNVVEINGCCIHLADMDRDGDLDIISGSQGEWSPALNDGVGASLRVYENNGQGAFTVTTILSTNVFNQAFVRAQHVTGITAADMDGDRDLDIIMIQGDHIDRVVWIPNNGNGNYGNARVIREETNGGRDPVSVDTGDVDGDGDIDLVVAYRPRGLFDDEPRQIACLKNPGGAGSWQTTVIDSGEQTNASRVRLVDLNQDGALDVVTNDGPVFYPGDGRGNFGSREFVGQVGSQSSDLHIVDFDNDGDLDIFSTCLSENENRVCFYESEGGGSFLAGQTFSGRAIGRIDTVDLNGDGALSVVTYGTGIRRYGDRVVEREFFRVLAF